MGFKKPYLVFQFWIFLFFCLKPHCDSSDVSVRFLKAPHAFSRSKSAYFSFEILLGSNGSTCTNCTTTCKLDNHIPSNCRRKVLHKNLQDGIHTFEVCSNESHGFKCASYNWTVDTVPPTAYVLAEASYTDALNVKANISFSEPCNGGGGGFSCSSAKDCNLLVYGDGQAVPESLTVLQPNIKFSLVVNLLSCFQYGRVVLAMDTGFCTDSAGNKFTRTRNSTFVVHFDRRIVLANLKAHVPEKQLQLNSQIRTVLATNKCENLKVYLYFSKPILNSTDEIWKCLKTSQGFLSPTGGSNYGNRKFGFKVENISTLAIVTVSIASDLLVTRERMMVLPTAPITFLYDSQRPDVKLIATHMATRETTIPILIKFSKPVFGFKASHISIFGGNLQSFHEINGRTFAAHVHANNGIVSISIPDNITADVAGNKNLASNILKVRHYSVPVVSFVLATFTTAAFALTSVVAGLLTVSTVSLQSAVGLSRPRSLRSDPARNLFRILCHVQVWALSRWLSNKLPVEYYEFANGLQWSIPYIPLPWETEQVQPLNMDPSSPINPRPYSSKFLDSRNFKGAPSSENLDNDAAFYGLPLGPMEYQLFFVGQTAIPEAEYISDPQKSNGWSQFYRSMFWLVVIGGSLVLLHILLILVLKFRKKKSKKLSYGALVFPRFEIFLLILAVPCLCKVSMALVKGGTPSGIPVGILLLSIVSILLVALFLFLSIGITFGQLLQYKEVHREGQIFHWYQDIVRVTLGPGKRGQWTWKGKANAAAQDMLGPLFEDLRGPPKYMLSQIVEGGNPLRYTDRIIASDDETEDAEAPFIQKLFGILRIYFTLLETLRRACLGIMASFYAENSRLSFPTITLICITSFELFFMVLKKPFIKKKVQLVEIISVSAELGIFVSCLVLSTRECSTADQTKIGIFMLCLCLVALLSQMINEWYALYRQTKRMDPVGKSFLSGLKMASVGFLLFFFPQSLIQKLDCKIPLNKQEGLETGEATSSGDRNHISHPGSESPGDKPWLKRSREPARDESSGAPNDPSTSRWSGFRSGKRSKSSSGASSNDFKSKARGLYKDLETIFASK